MLPRLIREVFTPIAGLGLIVNEGYVRHGDPRLYLIVLYAAMIGLPNLFSADQIASVVSRLKGVGGNGNGNGHGTAHSGPPPVSAPTPPDPPAHFTWRPAWLA